MARLVPWHKHGGTYAKRARRVNLPISCARIWAARRILGVLVCNDENEGTQIFFASRRHVAHITRATAGAAGYCPLKKRPQKLQPLANTVFLEHGRTRWPRTPQAAHVLQQCLELCWSWCNLTASDRWLHAGSRHHLLLFASSWAARAPAADHEAVLHACVSCVLCGTAVACVCMQYFS